MVKSAPARPSTAVLMFVVSVTLAGVTPLFAQEVRLTASADTNTLRVGEQVRVTVSVEHPGGYLLRNLGPADSLKGLEIIGVDSAAPAPGNGGSPFRRVYTFTAFDSGTYVVPPFVVYYSVPSDTALRSVSGAPIVLFVRGVDVDTSAEIRAIKPPLDVPLTFGEVLPYLGVTAAIALICWLVYYILKKRKRGEKFIPGPPPRPPDELALNTLRSIEAERLWQRGKVKEYHTALSDVLRTYIERRFAMPAMESTSEEILSSPPVVGLLPEGVSALRDVLTRSDLVKFAKFIPPPEQNERSFTESVSFVELTRGNRVPEAPAPVHAGTAESTAEGREAPGGTG